MKTTGRGGHRVSTANPAENAATEALQDSFERTLTKDPVGRAVLGDKLLMELGMFRAGENYGNESGKLNYARDRMRRMGRLLLHLQEHLNTPSDFSALLTPDNFGEICNFALAEGKLHGSQQDHSTSTPHAARRVKEDVIKSLELKASLCKAGSQDEAAAKKLLEVRLQIYVFFLS